MSVMAFSGIIKQGQILLTEDIELPENTQAYVVVPEMPLQTHAEHKWQLHLAAEALAPYYMTDEDLTAFTALDGEAFHEPG